MVSITKEQVAEIVARTKEGTARYRIAEDMGLPPRTGRGRAERARPTVG